MPVCDKSRHELRYFASLCEAPSAENTQISAACQNSLGAKAKSPMSPPFGCRSWDFLH